ncbi:unnamed protein product [Dracunculus medinensis]|uniref:Uncharacterized protein n=1 Tax=Dracunculus medinensis TaxID=318479 RepID=A0A0N4UA02_DRAME|nr:unnamed protein product [Dracunculus medinensis]
MSNGKESRALESLTESQFGIDDSEVLDGLSKEDIEEETLCFQLCQLDPLYPAYFKHMNTGRMKVNLFQRI